MFQGLLGNVEEIPERIFGIGGLSKRKPIGFLLLDVTFSTIATKVDLLVGR